MKKPKIFARIVFVMLETFLIMYGKISYDYLRNYENVKWIEVLLRPEKYKGQNISVSGRVFNFYEESSVLYIHQLDENSLINVWKAEFGRQFADSSIKRYSNITVYGKFRGIDGKSLLPLVKVYFFTQKIGG